MYKLSLEKAEEPKIKLPTFVGSWRKQGSSRKKHLLCFIDYAKAFDFVDHDQLWKILKEMGVPDHLTVSWETCMQIKKQQLEPCVEQLICSKSGKECDRAVYCHLAYLTDMRSTSCKMPGWRKHKLESRTQKHLPRRNIKNLRYADDTTLMAESEDKLKSLLMRVKEESEKSWLKTQHSKS